MLSFPWAAANRICSPQHLTTMLASERMEGYAGQPAAQLSLKLSSECWSTASCTSCPESSHDDGVGGLGKGVDNGGGGLAVGLD